MLELSTKEVKQMNREEFMKLNPCIRKSSCSQRISQQDILAQAIFLSKRKFIFNKLRQREAELLKLRLGLEDGRVHTQLQIAELWGVSTPRIQQLEKSALRRLSTDENIELLMKYDDTTIGNRIIKTMVKNFNYRELIFEDIQKALLTDKMIVKRDGNVSSLYIPSTFNGSIKKKLVAGGITTVEQLIKYLSQHDNLKEFGLGDTTYSSVIFSMVRLIENRTVVIASKELLDSYYANKAKYLNYLTANNLTDKAIFPEIQEIEEEIEPAQKDEQEKKSILCFAEKVFGANPSNVLIDELRSRISARSYNALRRAHIVTISDLIDYYYNNNRAFSSIKGISAISETEIFDALQDVGLELTQNELQYV